MESSHTSSSLTPLSSNSSGRQKEPPSWRSIFSRKKSPNSTIDTFYTGPYSSTTQSNTQTSGSVNQSFDIPHRSDRPLKRAGSVLSWSPFARKNQPGSSPPRLTAREVYHQPRIRGSRTSWTILKRSKTADSYRKRPIISGPIPILPPQYDSRRNSDVLSHEWQEQEEWTSAPICTVDRSPEPDAGYPPRSTSLQRVTVLRELHTGNQPICNLGEHDPDKRDDAFTRIHPEGWNQVIPKHWVEDQFTDDGAKTTASQSTYSQNENENQTDISERPKLDLAAVDAKLAQVAAQPLKAVSKLEKMMNPRFIFEESDDEKGIERAESLGKSIAKEDQVWWQTLSKKWPDKLSLTSIPYNMARQSRMPRPIKKSSRLKTSQLKGVFVQQGSHYGGFENDMGLSPSPDQQDNSRTQTGPSKQTLPTPLIQPMVLPRTKSDRTTVDEFFHLQDAENTPLIPRPLNPKREGEDPDADIKSQAKENRKRTIYQSWNSLPLSARNKPILPSVLGTLIEEEQTLASQNSSWETIRCMREDEPSAGPSSASRARMQSSSRSAAQPHARLEQNPARAREPGDLLEDKVDVILNLYIADQHEPGQNPVDHPSIRHGRGPRARDMGVSLQLDNPTAYTPIPVRATISHAPFISIDNTAPTKPCPGHSHFHSHMSSKTMRSPNTGQPIALRQEALFAGDYLQSPGSSRWDRTGRGRSSSGATVPIMVLDKCGNTWI